MAPMENSGLKPDSINVFAMSYIERNNDQPLIVNLSNNPVISYPIAPQSM